MFFQEICTCFQDIWCKVTMLNKRRKKSQHVIWLKRKGRIRPVISVYALLCSSAWTESKICWQFFMCAYIPLDSTKSYSLHFAKLDISSLLLLNRVPDAQWDVFLLLSLLAVEILNDLYEGAAVYFRLQHKGRVKTTNNDGTIQFFPFFFFF